MQRVVLDTNILISAMRSNRGPAFRLLSLVGTGRFEICVSVALVLEYEAILRRVTSLEEAEIAALLDFLCAVARRQRIFYLWRPCLRDPQDDMVLELAVASRSSTIVTSNLRDFTAAERFGVAIREPAEFLRELGDAPWEP